MSKTLFKNKKIEVIDLDGYTILKSPKPGRVAVLPFRLTEEGFEFLFRLEPIVARNYRREICSLTGTLEEGEDVERGALRELYEESGFWIEPERLLPMGELYETKASSTSVFLYAADVTSLEATTAPGDGSELEANSSTEWVAEEELPRKEILDGVLLALLAKWRLTFSPAAASSG